MRLVSRVRRGRARVRGGRLAHRQLERERERDREYIQEDGHEVEQEGELEGQQQHQQDDEVMTDVYAGMGRDEVEDSEVPVVEGRDA